MIKGLKITRVGIIAFFVSLILVFLSTSPIFAQEDNPEATAKKYGVTFPVAELGGCKDFSSCRAYCGDETNKEQCISFAKKKGFYEEKHKDEGIIKQAQSELGCDSESSCRSICEKEENIEKCSNFAQKHNLGGGPRGNPKDRKVLEKAKEILGCDSEASCRSICENPQNQEKCSNFASQTGLGGGTRRVGPGGCNSEESCKAFCENNKDECRKFGGPPDGADSIRRGPGGCDSEESCKKYCEANPKECGGGERGREGFDGYDGRRDDLRIRDEGRRPPEGFRAPEEGRFKDSRGPNEGFSGETREEFRPTFEQGLKQEAPPQEVQPQSGGEVTPTTREVQGVSTNQGLLQRFLNWLF